MILPILYIVSFLDGLAFTMLIIAMSPYVFSLGGTQFYLGVLGSVSALINLVWNPIVGSLSDSLGRKTVLLQCLLVCIIGNFLNVWFGSLTIFAISRLFGAFGTQIMVLLKSYIDDNIKSKESKMTVIHRMQALGGVCFIFGSLISGFLSDYENGYTYIFGLISAMYSINFGLICLIKDTQVKTKSKNKKEEQFSMLQEVKKAAVKLTNVNWPKYWDLFATKLILDFTMAVFHFSFAQTVMKRFGLTAKHFGYVFASICGINVIQGLTMTKLKKLVYANDESGLTRLQHSCLILTYACLGLGLSTSFPIYYIHLIPFGLARGLVDATFTEVILSRASPDEKGSIMGTFETTMSFGGLIAPIVSGIVSEFWGDDVCMMLCAIPLTIGTIVTYSQKRKVD